ncbi:MAG: hypothetical protein ABEI06_07895 [Halobacteriaceae archaeon]
MDFNIDLSQLEDELEEELEEVSVPIDEVFTDSFMREHTNFENIEQLFAESTWTVESAKDIDLIPSDQLDKYIDERTEFDSWSQLEEEAAGHYIGEKAGP